jgi:hypothetical protein
VIIPLSVSILPQLKTRRGLQKPGAYTIAQLDYFELPLSFFCNSATLFREGVATRWRIVLCRESQEVVTPAISAVVDIDIPNHLARRLAVKKIGKSLDLLHIKMIRFGRRTHTWHCSIHI